MTLEDPNLAETDTRASILGLRKLALAKPPMNRHHCIAMDRRAGSRGPAGDSATTWHRIRLTGDPVDSALAAPTLPSVRTLLDLIVVP